jgi:hypothetical protein
MSDLTTIKVPPALRDRIKREAAHEGITAATFLSSLLDRYERDQRLEAVGRAYADRVDSSYTELTAEWDELAADGLERE